MSTLSKLRRLVLRQNVSVREASRRLGISRNTATKWLKDGQMVEPRYPQRVSGPSILDPYKEQLSQWLKADSHRSKRDRRGIKAMFEALRAQGYSGSRGPVYAFAQRWQQEQGNAARGAGFVPLSFERGGLRYWQCGDCDRQCSLISGTVFESSKLPLTRWFLAMQLLTQAKNNVSALELMRQLGVSYRTAWLIKHKLMEAMRHREDGRELDGRVELDDAYLGGERSGGKTGRGSENKVPIVAAVQTTADGQPVLACLRQQPHTEEEVAVFAASHLAPSATVVSDGLWCFRATTMVGARHERIVTGGGKASVQLPQFRAVNTLLGNLKTAISGTYHAFAFAKYAHRYLAEFQYRFNRRFNMKTLLPRLLAALVAAPPSPEHWLRTAEVSR